MKQLNPYLAFPGNAEEALNFYKDVFGGTIESLMRFDTMPADGGMQVPEDYKNKVLHSTFKADQMMFMASDSMPGQKVMGGDNVSMSVNMDKPEEVDMVFNKLAQGGKVTMPLANTFWGAYFGMLQDKYGINWMFNCDLKK
jgi:PhnB protein